MNDDYINLLKSKYPPIVIEEAPEPCLNYDVHGPRLMISKIENENFKSYGGIRILGPFHKNFSCIIGPNGSGKSNVIDSLLFVFGFRANKIRSKKLSVLIHKSERFPDFSSCSVRVYFQRIKPTGDGDNDFEVIENSEFVVTRTAFKDNTSIYKINDKKVVNKEIIGFLKKQGIDLDHNRFLILQGEVEQIALMKPKASNEYEDGLLEYLEDIIGSHRFKEPLNLLFKRLEELCELRTEKLNRVKIVGKEKKDLEGDRNEAVKYLRLCNEITIRKNISFQIKMKELSLLEVSAFEKQNEVKKELDQIKSDIDKINKLCSEKEKELKQTVQQHLMKVQHFDLCKKQFNALEMEDTELRDQRKHCKLKLDELGKAIKLKEKEIVKYEHVPDESVPRIEQLMGDVEKLEELKQKEIINQETARAMVNEETKELQNSRNIKMSETRKQQDLLKNQEVEITNKKCELDCLVGNYKKDEQSYLALESKQKSTREKIEKTKEELKKLNECIPTMNLNYNAIQEEIQKLRGEQSELITEIAQLNFKLQSTQTKRAEHRIINFLLEQQRFNKLTGIVGRLGNLGSIDPKYDVAVSTACRRLDSIVTETISNAQRCVELMRSHNVGKAEFLAFDKIRHWETQANKKFLPIPGAPRAMDLLTIKNPELRSVFYFALRDLLISQDTRDSARMNKDHDWLKSSTYKPCEIKEYVYEDNTKPDNELVASNSDSNNSTYSKTKVKKKKKYKKLKRGKIIKHYLNDLPSISDERCEFRKYNFLDQMPKEDRSQNYFVDLKGNSQISHYGCIYEKHISKYRSKTTESSKTRVKDRYFDKLKSHKSSDSFITIEKRLCDSRCICKQPFIPVPFDIVFPNKEIMPKENDIYKNQALNETVAKDPHNIEAWIRLINIQSDSCHITQSKSSSDTLVSERQLMIAEKALSRNSSNLQLHLMRMTLGAALWSPEKLQKEWGQLIFAHSTNIDVWRFYIDQTARHSIGFSVDKLVAIYSRCFSTFYNVMSGRTRVKTITADTIFELIDLFAELCDFLAQAGYRERALACWQAVIEYNLFAPSGLAPRSTGSLLDDPMLRSFQLFWQSGAARIGSRGARGWATSVVADCNTPSTGIDDGGTQSESDRVESSLLARDNLSESEMWLELEQARLQDWWYPVVTSETDEQSPEDSERLVPFSVVQPFLITLHDPQNVEGILPVVEVIRRARRMLSLLFLDFLDCFSVPVSISHELAPDRIRWRQLTSLTPFSQLLAPVQIATPTFFVTQCLERLRDALPTDPGWTGTIASLELARAFRQLTAEPHLSWKHALTTVKKTAKLVLASAPDNRSLWSEYARLLTELVATEARFSSCHKARGAVIKEACTVVEWVLQTVTKGRLDEDSLGVLTVSLELVQHNSSNHGDHCQAVEDVLRRAASTVKDMLGYYSLKPPSSVADISDLFANGVANFNATGDYRGWYYLVYFQALTRLIQLDVQKFQQWMKEECLPTISGIGSSCMWSRQYLYQLSQLLEWLSSFISWFYRCQSRNDAAILRLLLGPITNVFSQIQLSIKVPILEAVISPKLVQNCIGSSIVGQTQRFAIRNFLWHLVAAFETDIVHKFNRNCQAVTLLLLNMEMSRLDDCAASTETDALFKSIQFGGRVERVRSTLNRLIGLRCSHWRYRVVVWHAFLGFESRQDDRRDDFIKGVFYRAVTEMPAIKSVYLTAVALVPSTFDEVTLLMKNNHVRICAPIEEVKLLIRIRQARHVPKTESREDFEESILHNTDQ